MNKMTKEDYDTRFPKKNASYFDALSDDEKKDYLSLVEAYQQILIPYIIQLLELKEYDNFLSKSKNNFKAVNSKNMDIYQFVWKDYLQYFYLRNNIYIERLSQMELQYLALLRDRNILNLNDEIINFLNQTLMKVLLENNSGKNNSLICYGTDSLDFYKPDNAIIIGVRYEMLGLSQKEGQLKEEDARKSELFILKKYIEGHLSDKIHCPVCVIVYNDFSIKKINGSSLKL